MFGVGLVEIAPLAIGSRVSSRRRFPPFAPPRDKAR
jgi:hypothetical protein